MKRFFTFVAAVATCASACLIVIFAARAAAPSAADKKIVQSELAAIARDDYGGFVRNGTSQFKAAITMAEFESVRRQVAPMLKSGYTIALVHQSVSDGEHVTAWRLDFRSGQAAMAQLAQKSGSIDGFLLKPALIGTTAAGAAAPSAADKKIVQSELAAIARDDYGGFVRNGTSQFKAAITMAEFESVRRQVAPMLKSGYTIALVHQSVSDGEHVTAWRLDFRSGQAAMAQLAQKSGSIDGFLLKPA